jgi:hypothetical protein
MLFGKTYIVGPTYVLLSKINNFVHDTLHLKNKKLVYMRSGDDHRMEHRSPETYSYSYS